jgi:hypothetical protein
VLVSPAIIADTVLHFSRYRDATFTFPLVVGLSICGGYLLNLAKMMNY